MIIPTIGLKASFLQSESYFLDNLQLVSIASGAHAIEVLNGAGIGHALLQGSLPHMQPPHMTRLGLFLLAGGSAFLVRDNLPAKEEEEEGDDDEEDDEEEANENTDVESGLPEGESDGFEGFIEDPAPS